MTSKSGSRIDSGNLTDEQDTPSFEEVMADMIRGLGFPDRGKEQIADNIHSDTKDIQDRN